MCDLWNAIILVKLINIFRSDHKFFPPTGMTSFWTFEKNSIKISDDSDDYCVGINSNLLRRFY